MISMNNLKSRVQLLDFSCPRIGRVRYLGIVCFWGAVSVLGSMLGGLLTPFVGIVGGLLALVITLFALMQCFIAAISRLHDLNAVGYWSLILLIPVIGFLFALYLLFAASRNEGNRYGASASGPDQMDYVFIIAGLAIIIMLGSMGAFTAAVSVA